MRLERNGNYFIKDIQYLKKEVVISFENGESISLSDITFNNLEENLYVGKELTSKDITNINNLNNISKYLTYAYSLLNKKRYSEYKLKEKLLSKGATISQCIEIINILKDKGYIDDSSLIRDIVSEDNEKLYGKYKIIHHLKTQGLVPSNIDILFKEDIEIAKANKLVVKLEDKYHSLSYLNKTKHIHSALAIAGYETSIISIACESIKERNEIDELINLEHDLKLAVLKPVNLIDGKLNKEKIFKSLMAKGYLYNDICICWEEHINEINK